MSKLFKQREILERLSSLEATLTRIESRLAELDENARLRAELRTKEEQVDALARQGLHVVELLGSARKEAARLKQGGSA